MIKQISLTILLFTIFAPLTVSQNLTQTVRGTVVDTDSKLPLIGVSVTIPGNHPLVGTATDKNGEFRLNNIPIGRITLQVSHLGYESKTITNIVVNSGKEVVLQIGMWESVEQMEEVVVTPANTKGEAVNDMSLVSARSVSVEETWRYAGSYNDPSQIVANFAGVAQTAGGSNDVIVRGNSPKYMQWRLEGVEITNPNHFAVQSGIGVGGLSALNNNLLTTSDFYTGAFAPEYGNVLSAVYDIKLRPGNNEHFESSFGFGMLGTDFTVEGPFSENYNGSYLVNYRYSTAALITQMGLIEVNGTPKFQDLNYKVVLPTDRMGRFSIFGLGGYSSISVTDIDPGFWDVPGDRGMHSSVREDFEKKTYLFNTGINNTFSVNEDSFLQTSLSFSREGLSDDAIEAKLVTITDTRGSVRDSVATLTPNFKSRIEKSIYRAGTSYHLKWNPRNKIQAGIKYALHAFDIAQSRLTEDGSSRFTISDFDGYVGTLQNFISWKHRFNEDVSIVSGLHNMNVLFNDKSTLELRIALNWDINGKNSVYAGYGNHSSMESTHHYFARVEREDGSVGESNNDLGLLKAHHFVIGYERRFTRNLMAKLELYYQDLYNLPVENNNTSHFATLNEGTDYKYVDLVHRGTGENYGIEITIERFFGNQYYFLMNGSLFESTYRSPEGVERNTKFNRNYLFNFLAGKEFTGLGKNRNQTFSLNLKAYYGGGQRIIPLLRDNHGNLAVDPQNNLYWNYDQAYEHDIEDVYSITVSASYKFNRPRATHEIYLNIDNLTNAKSRLSEFYDESEPGNIGYKTQLGLLPNLIYKVYF